MAGFARCSRCNHALTSVHVEAVPALGALPAASRVLVVACPNCRAALGTSIIGPARTDARSRFHERRSLRLIHAGDSRSARLYGDCSKTRGAEAQPACPAPDWRPSTTSSLIPAPDLSFPLDKGWV